MERRNFIKGTLATAATASVGGVALGNESSIEPSNGSKFNLKYAPNFKAFPEMAGSDPIDFIKFCNDQGFRAIFDNNLMKKEPGLQEKIANELKNSTLLLGVYEA